MSTRVKQVRLRHVSIRQFGDFSVHHGVVPRITKVPLEDAGKMLDLMNSGKLRGRAVLVLR